MSVITAEPLETLGYSFDDLEYSKNTATVNDALSQSDDFIGFPQSTLTFTSLDEADSMEAKNNSVFIAAKKDIQNSENKKKTVGAAAGVIGTQLAGIPKAATVATLPVSMMVLEKTGSPLAASIVGGSSFCLWVMGVTKIVNCGMNEYPNAMKAITARPKIKKSAENAAQLLPGFSEPEPLENNASLAHKTKRIPGFVFRHGKRGLGVYGTTAAGYILTAYTSGHDNERRKKFCNKLGYDGGAFVGLTVLTASEALVKLEETNPRLADSIYDNVTNPKYALAASLALIMKEFVCMKTSGNNHLPEKDNSADHLHRPFPNFA